jgi:hypothetical protein
MVVMIARRGCEEREERERENVSTSADDGGHAARESYPVLTAKEFFISQRIKYF